MAYQKFFKEKKSILLLWYCDAMKGKLYSKLWLFYILLWVASVLLRLDFWNKFVFFKAIWFKGKPKSRKDLVKLKKLT